MKQKESWWLVQTSVERRGMGFRAFKPNLIRSAVGFDEHPVVIWEHAWKFRAYLRELFMKLKKVATRSLVLSDEGPFCLLTNKIQYSNRVEQEEYV
ncbi:hypothetical protein J6TS1_26890 [Siminovitchia terrae]|uniref:Uncharacterized protein n=1 Tax=Siminovitchia terrae TaxID=1914933 RepID=A0ABQ4KYU0_SIMTE|nr:hypothetical protein J6TS1_26890 [Siminovitchia terrae]